MAITLHDIAVAAIEEDTAEWRADRADASRSDRELLDAARDRRRNLVARYREATDTA